jgi:limonene-1,2-epoxide hydrolase
MTEHPTPLAVARAFIEAWTRHDMETAARYVANDVVFDGPIQRSTGIAPYMEGLIYFAQYVTGTRIVAAFGDSIQALIMHDVTTGPFGILTFAELLTVQDGKIQTHKMTFDTYEIRKAGLE